MSSSPQSVKWAVTAIAAVASMMLVSAPAQAGPVLYVDLMLLSAWGPSS